MIHYLLDVNVLIAFIDPAHVQHDAIHEWLGKVGHKAFATCTITENGLLRIVGHPKYPNCPRPPSAVAHALSAIRGCLVMPPAGHAATFCVEESPSRLRAGHSGKQCP